MPHGKRKAASGKIQNLVDPHIVEVAEIDQVVAGDGIAQIHVSLAESQRRQGCFARFVGCEDRAREHRFERRQRQVVFGHRHAQARQPVRQRPCFVLPHVQHGFVAYVALRQVNCMKGKLIVVRAPHHIHAPLLQGIERGATAGKLNHPHVHAQHAADCPKHVGRHAFVIGVCIDHFHWCEAGRRRAHDQHALAAHPLPLGIRQRRLHPAAAGTAEQPQLGQRCGRSRREHALTHNQ
ncbi:hypothetical protein D3C81_413480 [compost metagenome]